LILVPDNYDSFICLGHQGISEVFGAPLENFQGVGKGRQIEEGVLH
jgi:anthranilate/para-aminobenzoate synthase component II